MKLASSVATAYKEAVLHMGNVSGGLRYSWILYLPVNTSQSEFFETLRKGIVDKLRAAKVMEAWSGRKTKACELIRVPKKFCDPTGCPFMMSEGTKHKYVAGGYPETSISKTDALGAGYMDELLFYTEMTAVLEPNPADFFSPKSNEWHSSLARAMLPILQPLFANELPVIPLRGGKWVSSGSRVYFPGGVSNTAVPEGIELDIVDAEAAADPHRKALFVKFGVQDLAISFIRAAIETTHSTSFQDTIDLHPDVLVSHVEFLYRTRDATRDTQPMVIQMAADKGPCRSSSAMYLPLNIPSAASGLLPHSRTSKYGFLHPAYAALGQSQEGPWIEYLQNSLLVSIYPRLYDPKFLVLKTEREINVHDDFVYIMSHLRHNTWLTVLKDGWEHYKVFLDKEHGALSNHEREKLTKYLSSYKVRCTGTSHPRPLHSTYLPLDGLTAGNSGVTPFLDVPDPHDPRWTPVLKCLGAGMSASVEFYLECLKGAKENEKVSADKIREILHKIEDCLEDNYTKAALAR